jgi:hypothetical protein
VTATSPPYPTLHKTWFLIGHFPLLPYKLVPTEWIRKRRLELSVVTQTCGQSTEPKIPTRAARSLPSYVVFAG